MTDDASVAAAAADVAEHEGAIDVLVNNAGIPAPPPRRRAHRRRRPAVFDVNVVGVVRVTHAFLPLLRASASPGHRQRQQRHGLVRRRPTTRTASSRTFVAPLYTSSKAALTMLTTQYAKACRTCRVNAADPGYTATDFNGHSGPQTVTEGTDAIVDLATIGHDGPTGTLRNRRGALAW